MSRYAKGREPRCPTQSPDCTGILLRRESTECLGCYKHGRRKVDATPQESISHTGNKCEIVKSTTERVRTLADLIRVCEIDTETWEIERWTANKWEMGSVDLKKQPHTTPLYQIKAVLVRRVVYLAAKDEVSNLIQFAKRAIPARAVKRSLYRQDDGLMLEIDIFDLHAGKLGWGRETGDANYDAKIAIGLYEAALDTLVARTIGRGIDHILLVTGNDLINSDSPAGMTTKGTPVSSDGRFHKTFGLVRETIIRGIERLRGIAPVIVPMIPGNHDNLTVWHLGDSLQCFYHACKDVTILNEPTQRKYHQFGKVMLMLTHGDKGKHPDYPLVMATEQPKMFGATTHREAHIGHRHEAKLQEFHGVRVRTLSALCSADAWHSANQFTGNARSAEAMLWHREEGLIGTATYTAPAEQQEAA
jgi:hypothetical protein